MNATVSIDEAKRLAARALASGLAEDPLALERGRLLDPVRIHDPDGGPAGWMVPVELGGSVLGFIQLMADGQFHRYASFHGPSRRPDDCPSARDWLDPEAIQQRARAVSGPDERLGMPILTYDRSPDRLVWAVQTTSPDGTPGIVFVAGTSAWSGSLPDRGTR